MPELVFTKARIKWGTSNAPTTNLSTGLRSVTINYSAELLDKTAMGAASRRRIAGLKDWNATMEFNQNFRSTNMEKFLFNMVGAYSSNSWLQIKPTSSTSPRYHGKCLLESYPIGGSIGALATVSVTVQGDGNLTRTSATR